MNIKKVGCGLDWSSYVELKEHHVVSQGWNEYGDLSFMYRNSKELWQYIDIVSDWAQPGRNALKQLMLEIKSHDIILAFEGNTVKGIAEVPEEFTYYYDDNIEHYKNCIYPLEWIDWDDFCNDKSIRGQGGQGVHGIENCYNPQELVNYIRNNWENFKEENKICIQPESCNQKLHELIESLPIRRINTKKSFVQLLNSNKLKHMISHYTSLLQTNHNLILTGAPGTGKTYLAKEIAESFGAIGERCGFVQFHPSFDYSDFIEGLRPIKAANSNEIGFERKDGIFMAFCRKALKAYLNSENKADAPKYVFVIDEINRGEMSKIFGELFFSVDPGYRGAEGRISTQYSNLWTEEDIYDDTLEGDDRYKFYIPENVYIIGTMNDIDRSVESMDFAFRRRFAFIEIKAMENTAMLDTLDENIKNVALNRMKHLNYIIWHKEKENEPQDHQSIEGLSSAYHIGASYFLKLKNYNGDFNSLWSFHIEGVLREYLRGMEDSEENIERLKKAFDDDTDTDY